MRSILRSILATRWRQSVDDELDDAEAMRNPRPIIGRAVLQTHGLRHRFKRLLAFPFSLSAAVLSGKGSLEPVPQPMCLQNGAAYNRAWVSHGFGIIQLVIDTLSPARRQDRTQDGAHRMCVCERQCDRGLSVPRNLCQRRR